VIISDMGRPPDQQAGYTLLRALRAQQIQTPFVIYAGSNRPEHKRQAASEGAQGSTNDPVELFAYVIQAIMEA
jgi:CheY-like chemotaxis protein